MNLHAADFSATGPAFIAGLVTSLHCAGMCGPLACSFLTRTQFVGPPLAARRSGPAISTARRERRPYESDPNVTSTIYHGTRLAAYSFVGAASGAIGSAPLRLLTDSSLRWIPWILVLFFVALAFRWERHLPKIGLLGRVLFRVRSRMPNSPLAAAASLGFATPLLPCGPLYLLFAFAMIAGSALHGAEIALAFGLGTVPLLWVVQFGVQRFGRILSPVLLSRTRTALALVTAAVIAWRLRATLGFPGPDPLSFVCF